MVLPPTVEYDKDLDDLEPTEPQPEIENKKKDQKDLDFSSKSVIVL